MNVKHHRHLAREVLFVPKERSWADELGEQLRWAARTVRHRP